MIREEGTDAVVTCEVCVEGVAGAMAAARGGAHRIELCAGLVEGGTTPSLGTITTVLEAVEVPVVVLIRPRGGDFLYSGEEVDAMLSDVASVREAGAFGIATGALTADGQIDRGPMDRVMAAADGLSVTFHRAFDMTRDPWESLEGLIELGADRVLTSGQERSVPEGLDLIGGLVERADGRISIMPGAGLRESNIRDIVRRTGVREVHFTASSASDSPMAHRNPRPLMGNDRVPGEYERQVTDPERVRRMMAALAE